MNNKYDITGSRQPPVPVAGTAVKMMSLFNDELVHTHTARGKEVGEWKQNGPKRQLLFE